MLIQREWSHRLKRCLIFHVKSASGWVRAFFLVFSITYLRNVLNLQSNLFSDFCQTWNKCWKSSPSSRGQNSSVRKLIWFHFSPKHVWNIEVKLFFITVSSDLQLVSMTHSKPSCLTPILTTIEEWWPTSLCLEVRSEKGTGSCPHISAKPTRSTSWGSSGQMSTPHRSCTWQSFSSFHFSRGRWMPIMLVWALQ